MKTLFAYDLEDGKEDRNISPVKYAVRYVKGDVVFVEVGDSYRHNIMIDVKHWNRLLRIIRNDELDGEGIAAILSLMRVGLREEYEEAFVKAIKSGIVKEIEE